MSWAISAWTISLLTWMVIVLLFWRLHDMHKMVRHIFKMQMELSIENETQKVQHHRSIQEVCDELAQLRKQPGAYVIEDEPF